MAIIHVFFPFLKLGLGGENIMQQLNQAYLCEASLE